MTQHSDNEEEKRSTTNISFQPLLGPDLPPKRKCARNFSFIFFLACLLLLIPLTIIFSRGTDLYRFLYGYDNCENTCGIKNYPMKGVTCSGKDMRNRSIALVAYQKINPHCPFSKTYVVPNKCVRECNSSNQLLFHRCFPPNNLPLTEESKNMKFFMEFLHIINQNLALIGLLSFGSTILAFGLFMCLTCHVAVTFWILTTFQLVAFTLATTLLWRKYFAYEESLYYLVAALGTTGYVIFLICFIIFFRNSFALIFGLYEEAVNAIVGLPLMLFQPLLALCVLILIMVSMTLLIFMAASHRYIERTKADEDSVTFEYISNFPALGYVFYVVFMMMWLYSFVDGCQSLTIAGAMSSYYFSRDKTNLRPLYSESIRKMSHNLGTVSSGSLIVTLMTPIRSVAEYMVNKAYIQTAIHGTPFYTSMFRGTKLVFNNIIHSLAISGFNYIVINGFSFLAMLLTMLAGIWINSECDYSYYSWMGLVCAAVGAWVVTQFMMSVINITSETVFFCFCEDKICNDGSNSPYYMNERLKNLMEKAKEVKSSH